MKIFLKFPWKNRISFTRIHDLPRFQTRLTPLMGLSLISSPFQIVINESSLKVCCVCEPDVRLYNRLLSDVRLYNRLLSFVEHITALTRSCFYHLRQLRVVSRSLSASSTATL